MLTVHSLLNKTKKKTAVKVTDNSVEKYQILGDYESKEV